MNIPKNLYGRDFANHLIRHWDFRQLRQSGSHIVLRTDRPFGFTASVPAHRPMKAGTLRQLLGDIAEHKGVTPPDILDDL